MKLLFGFVLYVFDIGSDIYVAVQHQNSKKTWWFGLTVAVICVSSIIVNVMAIFQIRTKWKIIAAFSQLSIFLRYTEVLKEPGARIGNSKKTSRTLLLARLRYVETITENAPQLCLQVYIMLHQRYFPLYTLFSAVLSLLSLVWCITVLEEENKQEFKCKHASIFSCSQFLTLVSRVFAIALFAYVFPKYLTYSIGGHLLIVTVMILRIERGGLQNLLLSFLAAYPFLFHSANNLLSFPTRFPKREMTLGYIILIVENIIIAILSLTIGTPDATDTDIVTLIGIGGILCTIPFSFMSFFMYSAVNFYEDHVDPQPMLEV